MIFNPIALSKNYLLKELEGKKSCSVQNFNFTHTHTHAQACTGVLVSLITRQKKCILHWALNYLATIFLCFSDHVLSWVNPIELLVQWVIVNGPDISKAVNGKDDIGALLFINHHAVNGTLLTEEQESSWSLKKKRANMKHNYSKSVSLKDLISLRLYLIQNRER